MTYRIPTARSRPSCTSASQFLVSCSPCGIITPRPSLRRLSILIKIRFGIDTATAIGKRRSALFFFSILGSMGSG